jgi:hypothetical protein
MSDMAYDVIYIDAGGSEEPVASHLERVDAADLARRTAAERGAGRLMLPGSPHLLPNCVCVVPVPRAA